MKKRGRRPLRYYWMCCDSMCSNWARTLGLAATTSPLSTLALSTLPASLSAEGAGFYSLLRTIGASVGIAIITTSYTRGSQAAWNRLGGFLNVFNPHWEPYLNAMGMSGVDPRSALLMGAELDRQARMVAIIDVYWLITYSFLVMLPLVWLLKQREGGESPSSGE